MAPVAAGQRAGGQGARASPCRAFRRLRQGLGEWRGWLLRLRVHLWRSRLGREALVPLCALCATGGDWLCRLLLVLLVLLAGASHVVLLQLSQHPRARHGLEQSGRRSPGCLLRSKRSLLFLLAAMWLRPSQLLGQLTNDGGQRPPRPVHLVLAQPGVLLLEGHALLLERGMD